MATNGSASVAVTSHDTLQFNWSVTGQSVENNTSTVYCEMVLIADGYGRISSTVSKSYSVTINGTAYGGSNTVGIGNNQRKVLWSGTVTIPHNADGTKSFSFSFSQQFSITFSGQFIGTISGSGSGTLNTIPRASTITCGAFTMGSAGAITITRASSGFTHTILWAFGTTSGTVVTKTAGTSVPWTPPTATMAPQIPNATAGTGTLTCITYSGNTEIGRTSIGFTAYLPASVVPSISSVTTTEGTAGLADKFGAFVQYKSTLKVSVSAAGIYGSTISRYTISFDGKTYSGNPCTTAAPTQSGSLTLTATVTDSRGRTVSKSITVTVLPYANPAISALRVFRCTSDGTADDSGDYVGITYAYTIASVNIKNTATSKIEYKRTTLTEWADMMTGNDYAVNTTVYPEQELLSDYQWDIRLTVSDYFGSTAMTVTLPSAEVILDLLASGKGLAIGKTAESDDTLDVKWAARFLGDASFDGTVSAPGLSVDALGNARFDGSVSTPGFSVDALGNTTFDGPVSTPGFSVDSHGNYNAKGNTDLVRLYINGTQVTDFVVAQGTSGSWKFIKWSNGLAICFTTTSYCNSNWATQTWGSDTCTDNITFPNYPFSFLEEPVCYASLAKPDAASQYGYFFWPAHNSNGSVSRPPDWCLVRPDGAPGTYAVGHPRIKMVAIGRWK